MSMRRGRTAALLVALTLLSGLLTACSDDDKASADDPGTVSAAEAQTLLDTRATAVLDGDLTSFLATLDSSDAALVKRQRRYFANMQDLPLKTLQYTVLKSGWPTVLRATSWGDDVSVPQVRVATQL